MHTVALTFTFISTKEKQTFLEILDSPDGLVITRAWPGCVSVKYFTIKNNDCQVFLWEEWKHPSNYESYMNMRKETGLFNLLENMLKKPFEALVLNEITHLQNVENKVVSRIL